MKCFSLNIIFFPKPAPRRALRLWRSPEWPKGPWGKPQGAHVAAPLWPWAPFAACAAREFQHAVLVQHRAESPIFQGHQQPWQAPGPWTLEAARKQPTFRVSRKELLLG